MPPADEIVHEMSMRWADLDSLNHVNNVVYLDYAAESRALLVDAGTIRGGPITQMTVTFLRPMLLSRHPVLVVSTTNAETLTQEITADHGAGRMVFAQITTVFGSLPELVQHEPRGVALPSRLRRSDIDDSGAVSPTKVFELFQEGRILFISERVTAMTPGRFVVGRVDVTFGAPIRWRPEPYEMRGWVSRIGDSSVTVEAELSDRDVVLAHATSTLVGFDLATQKSRRLSDQEKVEFGQVS